MRVIFLDDIALDEYDATKLLAVHHTDYAIGETYFGDPYRMHEDLLAVATTQYLDLVFPPAPGA
jgi:hypothetical protein